MIKYMVFIHQIHYHMFTCCFSSYIYTGNLAIHREVHSLVDKHLEQNTVKED